MSSKNVFSAISAPNGASSAGFEGPAVEFAGLYDNTLKRHDVFRTAASHQSLSEISLISDYRRLFKENELVVAFVDYLVSEILSEYHFEGENNDIELVENFWNLADMDSQLEIIVREAVLEGLGAGEKIIKGKELTGFQWIDASKIDVSVDEKGKEEWTQDGQKIKREKLFIYRPILFPREFRGISFIRAALLSFQALDDLKRDIPAAIKNLAYVTRIVKLNLSRFSDSQAKKDAIKNTKNLFARYDSATASALVMDSELGEVGYMGTLGQQGGSQSRLIPINDLIEPILSFITLRFAMAQGHLVQRNSNNAIIQMQEKRAKRALDRIRSNFARTVEREIIRDILGQEPVDVLKIESNSEPTKVRLVYNKDAEESRKERLTLIREWQSGLIPLGMYWERAGFNMSKLPSDKKEKFFHELSNEINQTRGNSPNSGDDVDDVDRNGRQRDEDDDSER